MSGSFVMRWRRRWRWYESVVVERKVSVVVVVFDGCHLSSRIGGEGSKDHPLLVVRTTQYFVVMKEELISDTEPVSTFLLSETLQMINIGPGSHHHFKCSNYFLTSWAVTSRPKQPEILIDALKLLLSINISLLPEIISLTEKQVTLGIKGLSNFSQSTITAATF